MKVLIADTDRDFALKAWAYYEKSANLVLLQPDSDQVVASARSWGADLVIVSARQVEQGVLEGLYALPARPAVLVTEHMRNPGRAWRAWQQGGDELLLKPVFKLKELAQAVTNALGSAAWGRRAPWAKLAASA